ncbi:MAG: hypothetical protein ACE5JJ_03410 [Nitrospinota bacterium]
MRAKLSLCMSVLFLSGALFAAAPAQAQEGKLDKALEAVGRAEEELAPEEADFGLGRALEVLEGLNEGVRPGRAEPSLSPSGPEGTPRGGGPARGFGSPGRPFGGFGRGPGMGRGRGR